MKCVIKPIDDVVEILGEQELFEGVERKSFFSVEIPVENGCLLYNTLTKECIYYGADEELKVDEKKRWYVVPENFKETDLVDELRSVLLLTKQVEEGYSSYTILTTTECNARCFYCYQQKHSRRSMSVSTAKNVVDYIHKTQKKGKCIELAWFGGEPLFNKNVIDYICNELKALNIDFKSSMITNGFLFNKDIISDAVSVWNLEKVQVTLDGTEEKYNKVKSYLNCKDSAYLRVINNIYYLLDADISVDVRLNIDSYNINNIDVLIDELADRFKEYKKLRVYCHPLFEETGITRRRKEDERKNIYKKWRLYAEKIHNLHLGDEVMSVSGRLKTEMCMADGNSSIVIMPDGYLGKCTSYTDSNYVGHINGDFLDKSMLEKFRKHREKIKECYTCSLYPVCIRLEMCQEQKNCYAEYRESMLDIIKKTVLNEYYKFLEQEKTVGVNNNI